MLTNKTLLTLNDVTIVPTVFSDIESRKQCKVFYENGKLPLFTAPMSCVIDEDNYETFQSAGVNTIIPRNVAFEKRLRLSTKTFAAIGLEELEYIVSTMSFVEPHYFCIDIANGHMRKLYALCAKAKKIFGYNIVIMTGNIANPETFYEIANQYPGVVDYVRCGIGGGSVCTTAANTSIHYPMASLISDIYAECIRLDKKTNKPYPTVFPKLVADGGFSNFDQIIKALALGADYVMLGKIFAKTEEACGETHMTYNFDNSKAKVFVDHHEIYGDKKYVKYRKYYGMSTKKAQKEFGGNGEKTAEGIERTVYVEYSLEQWVDNFISYLKSAMSYTGYSQLENFIGGPTVMQMTNSAFNSYFK